MKFLSLIFRDISKFYRGRKKIFFIVMIAMMFNSIGVGFFYGYFLYQYNETTAYYNKTKSYNFIIRRDINNNGQCDLITLLFDNTKLPEVTYCSASKVMDDTDSYVVIGEDYKEINLIGIYSKKGIDTLSGRTFTNSDYEKGNNVIITTTDILTLQKEALTNGDNLQIGGIIYNIIGQVIFIDSHYSSWIPLKTYLNNKLPIKYVHVEFESVLSKQQIKTLVSSVENLYSDISIDLAPDTDEAAVTAFWGNFIQVILIFILAMVNIFSLIYFWITINNRKYNIFLLCGCYKLKTIMLIMVEITIISLITSILGMIILYSLHGVLISYNLTADLTILDYILICSASIIISLIMGTFIGLKAVRNMDMKTINSGGENI